MTPSFPLYIGLPHPSDLKRFFKLLPARRDQRRCREGQLQMMKQMSRQEYRGSAGEYQADEQAGVARLTWRVSGR